VRFNLILFEINENLKFKMKVMGERSRLRAFMDLVFIWYFGLGLSLQSHLLQVSDRELPVNWKIVFERLFLVMKVEKSHSV